MPTMFLSCHRIRAITPLQVLCCHHCRYVDVAQFQPVRCIYYTPSHGSDKPQLTPHPCFSCYDVVDANRSLMPHCVCHECFSRPIDATPSRVRSLRAHILSESSPGLTLLSVCPCTACLLHCLRIWGDLPISSHRRTSCRLVWPSG